MSMTTQPLCAGDGRKLLAHGAARREEPYVDPFEGILLQHLDLDVVPLETEAQADAPLGREELQVPYREFALLQHLDHLVPDRPCRADNGYVE